MTAPSFLRFSYRDDPAVPAFPETVPLVVYDGVCALCSGWVRFILRRDGPRTRHLFASAQSPLGAALYRHYGFDPNDPETIMLIEDGVMHAKRDAVAAMLAGLGGPWRLPARALRLVPAGLANFGYDLVAKNRYRIGYRADSCIAPPPGTASRFLG